MYRGLFLFVLEFFLFGINLYGWQSVGINHAHICDFKNKLCPLRVLEVSCRLQGRREGGTPDQARYNVQAKQTPFCELQ